MIHSLTARHLPVVARKRKTFRINNHLILQFRKILEQNTVKILIFVKKQFSWFERILISLSFMVQKNLHITKYSFGPWTFSTG